MKTTLLVLAIAAGTALTAGHASAQERGPIGFEALDLNSDGQVTLEEMQGQGAARFAAADTDGDGALSQDELLAQAQSRSEERASEMIARMLERLDANEDGVIQADEMPERDGDRVERMFARADANEDGVITADEMEDLHADRGDRRGDDRRHGKGKGPRGDRG